jgi:hypothetical protein
MGNLGLSLPNLNRWVADRFWLFFVAAENFEEIDERLSLVECYSALAEVCEKREQYNEALMYFAKAITASDGLAEATSLNLKARKHRLQLRINGQCGNLRTLCINFVICTISLFFFLTMKFWESSHNSLWKEFSKTNAFSYHTTHVHWYLGLWFFTASIQRSGLLQKQFGPLKRWHPRRFHLQGDVILYEHEDVDPIATGENNKKCIRICDIADVRETDVDQFEFALELKGWVSACVVIARLDCQLRIGTLPNDFLFVLFVFDLMDGNFLRFCCWSLLFFSFIEALFESSCVFNISFSIPSNSGGDVTPRRRTFLLRATRHDEMKAWVSTIQDAIRIHSSSTWT